ncbi:MAG: DUF4440 domain-containing protein [Paracoccaceae bacterium]
MPGNAALRDTLLKYETYVWNALVAGDRNADATALHDSFLGVYPSGFATKAEHVNQLDQGGTMASFTLSQIKARPLGPDHALLSYRAVFNRSAKAAPETMFVSSIWQNTTGRWVNIFSQDTPASD